MPRAWAVWGLLTVCLAAYGCQGSTPVAKPDASDDPAHEHGQPGGSNGAGEQAAKPQLTVLDGVDSWEGNWVLAPTMERASRYLWLLRLAPDDNAKWTIQDLANEPMMGKVTGVEAKITDDQIWLEARIDNPKAQVKTAKMSFEGTLRNGLVLGNVMIGDAPSPLAARLIPTDAETLADYADSLPESGLSEFEKALREPDPAHGLWNVAKTVPRSPLALDVYSSLFGQIEKWNFTEDEARAAAREFTDAATLWGDRLQAHLEIDAGLNLAKFRKFIDLAEEFLDAGESRASKDSPTQEMKLKAGRINVRIARSLLAINGKDADAAVAAYADLQNLLVEQPYHPELLLALAEHAEKTKQLDVAIDYNLLLVGLPMMERMALGTRLGAPADDQMPHAALDRLWKEKHGSLDGLEAALTETYDREIAAILAKIREKAPAMPAADAGNRTLLVEFFTGTACEPCVAADLALEGALHDVPMTEVIRLTYHQHLPAPDPMTSLDGEGRGKFYNLEGTPFVTMNGAPIGQVGGPFFPAYIEQNYHALRAPIDFFLKMSTEVSIEPTAEVVDGRMNVKVAVTGVPDDLISKVRLRMVLAEDNVAFVAPNGIRHHHMVVRTMLGGTGGKAANKDKVLEYSIAMPLAEIKARQLSYLAQFEHGRRVKFSAKPAEMKPLHLVAFVQNETTKEVLQAAATPVQGELIYPEIEFKPTGEMIISPPGTKPEEPPETPADATPEKSTPEKSTPEKPTPEN